MHTGIRTMPALRLPWTRFLRTGPAGKEGSETVLWAVSLHAPSVELAYVIHVAAGDAQGAENCNIVSFRRCAGHLETPGSSSGACEHDLPGRARRRS